MTVAGIDENDAWYACLSASRDVNVSNTSNLCPQVHHLFQRGNRGFL